MDSLLRVEHVTISYNGKPTVEDVSFELKQGEKVWLQEAISGTKVRTLQT